MQQELKELRAQCDEAGATCGILGALEKKGKPGAQPAKKAHVGGLHRHH